MKIINISQVPAETVIMDGVQDCRCRVAVSPEDGAPNFALRVFEVAPGGHTPLHAHPYEHEIYVLAGQGTIWRENQEVGLQPGDVLFIPADERHQFKFICLIPAQFQKC